MIFPDVLLNENPYGAKKGSNLFFPSAEFGMMPSESALGTMLNSTIGQGQTPSPSLTDYFYRAAAKRGPNRSDPTAASTVQL